MGDQNKEICELSAAEKFKLTSCEDLCLSTLRGESLHKSSTEWSKFVTNVKLVKDLHATNFDQLHAYLEQHKLHANEVHLLHERNQDPLALVAIIR
ncbi:hypothetical protein Tco_0579641 [Tanacetum coccineum]